MLFATASAAAGVLWALSWLRAAGHAPLAGGGSTFLQMLAINAGAQVATIAFSYLRHSGDPDHEDSDRQQRSLERRLVWKKWSWKRIAGRHDALRGRVIQSVNAIRDKALCKMAEYRYLNLRTTGAPASAMFATELGHHLFRSRDFGNELSLEPPTITQIIETGLPVVSPIPSDAGQNAPARPNGSAPDGVLFPPNLNPTNSGEAPHAQ